MKRSLAAAVVVFGGTVAIATTAYASGGGSTGTNTSNAAGWVGRMVGSAIAGLPSADSGSDRECTLKPFDAGNVPGLPDFEDFPEPPELLYSEQTVRDLEAGKVEHQATQTGTVQDVSDDTVTVRSSDGTTWEWNLTDDTTVLRGFGREAKPADIETGDEVLVHGTVDGDARVADHVSDPPPDFEAQLERIREGFGDRLESLPDRLPELRQCIGGDSDESTALESAA